MVKAFKVFSLGWVSVITFFVFLSQSIGSFASESSWLVLSDKDLKVSPNSALDFSKQFPSVGSGKLIDERILCAPMLFTGVHDYFPPKDDLDEIVVQLKLRGYNMVRFHFLDTTLMKDAKTDFDFNSVQFDRLQYFLSSLKKAEIYWMIDAATSWNGAYGDVGPNRRVRHYRMKLMVHFDEKEQRHWKKMVNLILTRVNRYTGQSTISDPNLKVITLFNEMGLAFNTNKGYTDKVKTMFLAWSESKGYNFDNAPSKKEVSNRAALMNQFLGMTEVQTLNWMSSYIRGLGFKGEITAFNNGKNMQAMYARQFLDLNSVHAYYDAPSNYMRKGSTIKGLSSIETLLPYIQYFSLVRELGKPFIVDEYDHPFWSKWRREAGIAVPAYAAFQKWNGLCRYANPIVLDYPLVQTSKRDAVHTMGVGGDPIARAGETLSALLFRRGDVLAGSQSVGVVIREEELLGNKARRRMIPAAYSKLAFLTPIGNIPESKYMVKDHSRLLKPDLYIEYDSKKGNRVVWRDNLSLLTKNGIGHHNIKSDRYLNSTSQIELLPAEKQMKVITSKTEAVVFDTVIKPIILDKVQILRSSGSGLVSFSSLDLNALEKSDRILIIYATDARNSGSKYSKDGKRLLEIGSLPVQIKSESISLSYENNLFNHFSLYALNLKGDRVESIPVWQRGNKLLFDIKLSNLKNGPSLYFELIKERDK